MTSLSLHSLSLSFFFCSLRVPARGSSRGRDEINHARESEFLFLRSQEVGVYFGARWWGWYPWYGIDQYFDAQMIFHSYKFISFLIHPSKKKKMSKKNICFVLLFTKKIKKLLLYIRYLLFLEIIEFIYSNNNSLYPDWIFNL